MRSEKQSSPRVNIRPRQSTYARASINRRRRHAVRGVAASCAGQPAHFPAHHRRSLPRSAARVSPSRLYCLTFILRLLSSVVTCSVADHVVASSAHATKDQSASFAVLTLCVVTSIIAVTDQSLT